MSQLDKLKILLDSATAVEDSLEKKIEEKQRELNNLLKDRESINTVVKKKKLGIETTQNEIKHSHTKAWITVFFLDSLI